jgi:hypothetical protein
MVSHVILPLSALSCAGALQAYPPRRVGAYAEDTSQQQSAITQHMLASVGILADDTPVVGVVHPALARTIDTRPPAAPERSPEKPQVPPRSAHTMMAMLDGFVCRR